MEALDAKMPDLPDGAVAVQAFDEHNRVEAPHDLFFDDRQRQARTVAHCQIGEPFVALLPRCWRELWSASRDGPCSSRRAG